MSMIWESHTAPHLTIHFHNWPAIVAKTLTLIAFLWLRYFLWSQWIPGERSEEGNTGHQKEDFSRDLCARKQKQRMKLAGLDKLEKPKEAAWEGRVGWVGTYSPPPLICWKPTLPRVQKGQWLKTSLGNFHVLKSSQDAGRGGQFISFHTFTPQNMLLSPTWKINPAEWPDKLLFWTVEWKLRTLDTECLGSNPGQSWAADLTFLCLCLIYEMEKPVPVL